MKNAGKIFSTVCIVFILVIHLIQIFKPFEHQRYDPDPVLTYQAIQELREDRMPSLFDDPEIQQLMEQTEEIRLNGTTGFPSDQ